MACDCLALVALICLNQPARIEILQSPMMSGAVVDIDHLRIESIVSSDNITPADISIMKRECLDGGCFHYSRVCSGTIDVYRCDIYYVLPGESSLKRFSLLGEEGEVLKGRHEISFSPFSGNSMPISELSFDNGLGRAPSCLPRSGCTPSLRQPAEAPK
jgi:hypothetical protein